MKCVNISCHGRWGSLTAGTVGALAMIVSAYGEVNVERLDGTKVTRLIVHAGDGSVTQGTVATGPLGPAVVYDAEPTEYMTGCWDHTCAFGFADELLFENFPPGGGELRSYTFSYGAGYAYLFDECIPGDPVGDHCDCYCPTGGECDQGDPPYTINAALYDGPPGFCGGGLPIAGTGVALTTTASRPLGDRRIDVRVDLEPKVFVPAEVWGVVTFDIEDAWMVYGYVPIVGSSTRDGAMWLDGNGDGCWNEWECSENLCAFCGPGEDWATFHAEANAQVVFRWQPVLPPASTKHSATATYTVQGNQAILQKGGEPVWMEIHVSDFDPKQTGMLLQAWQAGLDSSGYDSGLQGTLTPPVVDCTADPGICATEFGPGSVCPFPPTVCPAGFMDRDCTDFLFYDQLIVGAVDTSTPDYRWASTLMVTPIGSSADDYYLGTLVLDVPDDAKGTFSIDFLQGRDTALIADDQFMPLIGLRPGEITVEVGRCCYDLLSQPGGCQDGLTANECAAKPGPVRLFPGETCDIGCPPSGACCDGTTGDCQENLLESECPDDPQSRWVKATLCRDLDPPCEEHTGACCVDGVCTDDVPESVCASDKWFKHTPCSDPDVRAVCLAQWAVPTVSAWGGLIAALVLAVLGKVYFGRRRGTG